jgi:hypothetical protein
LNPPFPLPTPWRVIIDIRLVVLSPLKGKDPPDM